MNGQKKLTTWQIILIALVLIIVLNLLTPVIKFLAKLATVIIIAGVVIYLVSKNSKA